MIGDLMDKIKESIANFMFRYSSERKIMIHEIEALKLSKTLVKIENKISLEKHKFDIDGPFFFECNGVADLTDCTFNLNNKVDLNVKDEDLSIVSVFGNYMSFFSCTFTFKNKKKK